MPNFTEFENLFDEIDYLMDDVASTPVAEEASKPVVEGFSTITDTSTLSPLEQMQLERKNRPTGVVFNPEESEKKKEVGLIQEKTLQESADNAFAEMDELIRKATIARESGVLKTSIDKSENGVAKDGAKLIEVLNELSDVQLTESGDEIESKESVREKGDRFLTSAAVDRYDTIEKEHKHIMFDENGVQVGRPVEPIDDEEPEEGAEGEATDIEEEQPRSEEEIKHRTEMVSVIIDKMNEHSLEFTPEEREKLTHSKVIEVKVVDAVELASLVVDRTPKSFADMISEYHTTGIQTPVVFPSSGFRAYMTALGVSEMIDLCLNNKNGYVVDDLVKRLSIVYNHMVNPSIYIENFDDFLKKFAHDDMDIAVWGAFVSTYPIEDTISLTCGKTDCKQTYEITYRPDQLLDWDSVSTEFIEKFKEIATTMDNTEAIANAMPIRKSTKIKLPYSGIIIEVGKPSAYDWVKRNAPNMLTEEAVEAVVGADPNERSMEMFLLTTFVRAVYFPHKDGKYSLFTSFKDVYDALQFLRAGESDIVAHVIQKYGDFAPKFFMPESVCPKCGNKSPKIPIDIASILFQKAREISHTQFEVKGI